MTIQRPIPIRADPVELHRDTIRSLARAIVAYAVSVRERGRDPEKVLKVRFEDDRLAPLILRAATTPLTISGAPGLTQVDLIDDLLVLVGKISAAAQVLQAGLQLQWGNAASIAVPMLETSAAKVTFVAEGAPIPVQAFNTSLVTVTPHKLAAIVVLTNEMLTQTNAETLVTEALRRSVGLSLDSALFDSTASSTTRPAGLRNGISALTPTAGGGNAAMVGDLALLAGAVAPIGPPIFVASPERAARLKVQSYSPPPYPIYGSPGVAATDLLAIAEGGVASVLGQPTFDSSRGTALHMDTAPSDPLMAGVPIKSSWQTDSTAVKVRMDCSWLLRDTRALAWLTGCTW